MPEFREGDIVRIREPSEKRIISSDEESLETIFEEFANTRGRVTYVQEYKVYVYFEFDDESYATIDFHLDTANIIFDKVTSDLPEELFKI